MRKTSIYPTTVNPVLYGRQVMDIFKPAIIFESKIFVKDSEFHDEAAAYDVAIQIFEAAKKSFGETLKKEGFK